MSVKPELLEEIGHFVTEVSTLRTDRIKYDIDIEDGLGLYGQDGLEFILKFSRKYKVDVSKFLAADYFSGEGIDFIGPIIRLFTRKPPPQKKTLTLYDLAKSVVTGRLDEETIQSKFEY